MMVIAKKNIEPPPIPCTAIQAKSIESVTTCTLVGLLTSCGNEHAHGLRRACQRATHGKEQYTPHHDWFATKDIGERARQW